MVALGDATQTRPILGERSYPIPIGAGSLTTRPLARSAAGARGHDRH